MTGPLASPSSPCIFIYSRFCACVCVCRSRLRCTSYTVGVSFIGSSGGWLPISVFNFCQDFIFCVGTLFNNELGSPWFSVLALCNLLVKEIKMFIVKAVVFLSSNIKQKPNNSVFLLFNIISLFNIPQNYLPNEAAIKHCSV